MAKLTEYKVWVEVEKVTIDTETGDNDYETVGGSESAGRFDAVEEAEARRDFIRRALAALGGPPYAPATHRKTLP